MGAAVVVSVPSLTLATGVVGAGAKTAKATGSSTAAHGAAVAVKATALPAGYTQVTSADFNAVAGTQTHGTVACPVGTKPVGGGLFVRYTYLAINMNSSYPTTKRNWNVDVNNAGSLDAPFAVYAICVKRSALKFTITTATFSSPAGVESVGSVFCPSGVLIGGGVLSFSSDTAANINSFEPETTTKFTAWMNNGSGSDSSFEVWAICRNAAPVGYSLQIGAGVTVVQGAHAYSDVACPSGSVPLSGGNFSTGSGLGQNLNSSGPLPTSGVPSWFTYFNNTDPATDTVSTYAICAGR